MKTVTREFGQRQHSTILKRANKIRGLHRDMTADPDLTEKICVNYAFDIGFMKVEQEQLLQSLCTARSQERKN